MGENRKGSGGVNNRTEVVLTKNRGGRVSFFFFSSLLCCALVIGKVRWRKGFVSLRHKRLAIVFDYAKHKQKATREGGTTWVEEK